MPRPRQFDETAVLDKVVQRFWSQGYAASSVRDIEAATGLTAASLYNAFGVKRALFRTALERYSLQETRACLREIEERIFSPAERIRTFVEDVTEAALNDPECKGCLVINTAVEMAPRDPEIAALIAGYLGEIEEFFRRNFEAAIAAGEAKPDVSPEDAARAFSVLMFGLRVLARSRPDRTTMEGAARPLLALLCDQEPAAIQGGADADGKEHA